MEVLCTARLVRGGITFARAKRKRARCTKRRGGGGSAAEVSRRSDSAALFVEIERRAMSACPVITAFNDRNEAVEAVDELKQAGFPSDEIGFAIRGDDAVAGGMITDATGTRDGEGAIKGATAGATIGGVLGAIAF